MCAFAPPASYEPEKKGVVRDLHHRRRAAIPLRQGRSRFAAEDGRCRALRPHLRTREGDIYNAEPVDKTVEDATAACPQRRAVRQRAGPERTPAATALVNLVYAIEQGQRLYVERIEIHGNIKTRDDVIRREFDIGEGDAYNRALIDRAERRLKALGYFKTVKIDDPAGLGAGPGRRPASRSKSSRPASSRSPAAIRPPPAAWPRSASATRIFSAPGSPPRWR